MVDSKLEKTTRKWELKDISELVELVDGRSGVQPGNKRKKQTRDKRTSSDCLEDSGS